MAQAVRVSNSSSSERASRVESFKVMDVLQRANALEAQGHSVLHCEIGQPQTGAPTKVSQAAVEALSKRYTLGYTDAFGLLPLREKIAEYYASQYPRCLAAPSLSSQSSSPQSQSQSTLLLLSTDRIVVTTGSSGAFLLAFTACFDAGDTVAVASSGYPCYRNILSALACRIAHIPVNAEFKVTATELQREIDQRRQRRQQNALSSSNHEDDEAAAPLKGLILSSPSNPTGSMLSPEELRDLCIVCEQNNIQFLSDEIYHGISYGTQATATALQFSNHALVINSFSKYYSMSGWRLGWMVIPSHLQKSITSLQQNFFISAPTLSQTAALKCWDADTRLELDGHVEQYRISRHIILSALQALPDLDPRLIAPADGGFYVYVDLGEANVAPGPWGSIEMCHCLLEEEKVAFTPGNDFEDPTTRLGNRRFRISYAGGVETARSAMERFRRFWPTWIQRVRECQQLQQENQR